MVTLYALIVVADHTPEIVAVSGDVADIEQATIDVCMEQFDMRKDTELLALDKAIRFAIQQESLPLVDRAEIAEDWLDQHATHLGIWRRQLTQDSLGLPLDVVFVVRGGVGHVQHVDPQIRVALLDVDDDSNEPVWATDEDMALAREIGQRSPDVQDVVDEFDRKHADGQWWKPAEAEAAKYQLSGAFGVELGGRAATAVEHAGQTIDFSLFDQDDEQIVSGPLERGGVLPTRPGLPSEA